MEDQIPTKPPLKWEGKATAELAGPTSEQIWPLISDFCIVHRWFPHVATCYAVEGAAGEPGLIRYCAGAPTAVDGEETTKWAKERLVAIDAEEKWFRYEILDNNGGFGEYVATFRVVDAGEEGCVIEWSYVADPVAGLTEEGLTAFVELTLRAMVLRLQEALCSPAT